MTAASATVGRVDWKMSESPTWTGKLPLVGQDRVRQEEVVPVGDEAEEEDERGDRLRERERDAQEGLQLIAAVDPRRIQEAWRERGREVDVGEVHAEREERERQDDRERVADQIAARSAPGRSGVRGTKPA